MSKCDAHLQKQASTSTRKSVVQSVPETSDVIFSMAQIDKPEIVTPKDRKIMTELRIKISEVVNVPHKIYTVERNVKPAL